MDVNTPNQKHSISRWQVMAIAWPIILSNLSTPLLGLVDTAVIGNLGEAALIGAIAIGAMIFSFLYWGFGFLRMGTTGLVAQAVGAGDKVEMMAALYRALGLGVVIGLILTLLQIPIASLAFSLIDGSDDVESAAITYFQIRIWAAPFSLSFLAILGYLLGNQDSRSMLVLQLILNGTNIVLDIVFVVFLEWGVAGVALATVFAEILAVLVGIAMVVARVRKQALPCKVGQMDLGNRRALTRMFTVNRDIMVRTLCLIFAFAWFTNEGAARGDITLAANAILMQFVTFSAFFLDGFALAAESLVGSGVGSRQPERVVSAIAHSSQLGFVTAFGLSGIFLLVGSPVINLLTNVEEVREATRIYFWWVVVAPPISVACYLLDGAFIGATRTREMRNAMIVSLAVYLLTWWFAVGALGNHGLWLSLMVYFIARAATLAFYLPALLDTEST